MRRAPRTIGRFRVGAGSLLLLASLAHGAAVDFETRTVTLALPAEPPQMDSARSVDGVSANVLLHVREGLTRLAADGSIEPGVAERWEITPERAVFHLREEARWDDGEPVTAHDFVYAWRRFVDPATAAPFALYAEGIENARAIVAGEKPPETLGVRARSDHVLEVRFEAPFPHLEAYLATEWFAPVRRDVSERYGERYGSEADRMRYNGPYVIDEWKHDQRLRLRRNPEYWNPERVWLERIHWDYIASDPRTRANLFRDGQIAYTTLDASTLPDAVARGKRIQRFRTGAIELLLFNHADDRPTRSLALREALALAVDPREIAARIERMPGARPAASMFPSTLRDGGRPLHATIGVQAHRPDFDAAREAVQRARRELGGEPLPPLVLLLRPNSTRTAEHLQTRWAEILGLEVRVVPQAFKQLLAQAASGEFDVLLSPLGAASYEPIGYMSDFESTQPNSFSRYRSEAFDACFQRARRSLDPEARMEAYRCTHERVVEDRIALPLGETASNYLVHPRLTGLRRSRAGLDPDLFEARILPPGAQE